MYFYFSPLSLHHGEVWHVDVCVGDGRGVQEGWSVSECSVAKDWWVGEHGVGGQTWGGWVNMGGGCKNGWDGAIGSGRSE